jgi:hypothetical protein
MDGGEGDMDLCSYIEEMDKLLEDLNERVFKSWTYK